MNAVGVVRGVCELSCLRIERMNASPATARGERAITGLVTIVDAQGWDHDVSILIGGVDGLGR